MDRRRFTERDLDWIGLALRLLLGGTLLVAGGLKVGNAAASARAVQAYQLLPFEFAAYVGYLLPILEVMVGVLLITGLFTRTAAVIGVILMAAFVFGIAWAWAKGLSIDCGCFGGGGSIAPEDTTYSWDIARDAGLALAGVWLVVRPQTALSADHRWFGRS